MQGDEKTGITHLLSEVLLLYWIACTGKAACKIQGLTIHSDLAILMIPPQMMSRFKTHPDYFTDSHTLVSSFENMLFRSVEGIAVLQIECHVMYLELKLMLLYTYFAFVCTFIIGFHFESLAWNGCCKGIRTLQIVLVLSSAVETFLVNNKCFMDYDFRLKNVVVSSSAELQSPLALSYVFNSPIELGMLRNILCLDTACRACCFWMDGRSAWGLFVQEAHLLKPSSWQSRFQTTYVGA